MKRIFTNKTVPEDVELCSHTEVSHPIVFTRIVFHN